ncbi:MAG: hypothetical protein JXR46_10745 [Calditrichaceae bacterium]|nr:hypothetical protein [Calditrichaceae bacterium]
MRYLTIFLCLLIFTGCASFNPQNFSLGVNTEKKLPDLNFNYEKNKNYSKLLNEFASQVCANSSNEYGEKYGSADLKVLYLKEKRNAANVGWMLPSLLTACTLNLLGFPIFSYKAECQVSLVIYDAENNIQKNYQSKATGTVYNAFYWGYSLMSEDRINAANFKAIDNALHEINSNLEQDNFELANNLTSTGKIQEIAHKKALVAGTVEAYDDFLSKYNYGRLAEDIQNKKIDMVYAAANKVNTKEGYEKFLSDFPENKYAAVVRDKIESLDQNYSEKLNSAGSLKDRADLILQYPDKAKSVIDNIQDIAEIEKMVHNYPKIQNTVIPILENRILQQIREKGSDDRFCIKNISTLQGPAHSITLCQHESHYTFVEDFEGDKIYLRNFKERLPLAEGSIHRYNGRIVQNEINNIVFESNTDKADYLTFAVFKELGYVYLRGKGKVILDSGKEIQLGE